MLMKPLAIAAGFLAAPAVNAFLIPAEISESDIEIAGDVAAALAGAPQISEIQPIDLECPGCPILIKGGSGFDAQVQTDAPSHLELTFSIKHQPEDGDRLVVNGFELYPNADPFSNALVAPQVLDRDVERSHDHDHDDGHRKRPHHRRPSPQPQRLGFGMHVGPAKKTQGGEFDLVEVELQIIEVGFSFVEDIPSLKINLIKQNNGRLLMTHIEKITTQKEVDAPDAQSAVEDCATVMCKIMALTREKVKQINKMGPSFGCHGGKNKGGMMRPEGHGSPHHEHPHHPRPHGIRPDHLKFSQREHSWGKLFKNIFAHILLPVLIGIVAGVSVSLIGMVVGTVIVSTWRFFFRKPSSSHRHHRRHSRSHSQNKVSHKEAIVAEEKSSLMEEAPPAYADEVPIYEDVIPTDKPAEA